MSYISHHSHSDDFLDCKNQKLTTYHTNNIDYLHLLYISQSLNNDAHEEKWIYYQTSKQTSSYFLQIIEGKAKNDIFCVVCNVLYIPSQSFVVRLMICVIINKLVGSRTVMTAKYFRICLDTLKYLKGQKIYALFWWKALKTFPWYISQSYENLCPNTFRSFRKSKMEQEPKYLIYDDVLRRSMINESSFIST